MDTLLQDTSGSNNNDGETRGSNKVHEDSINLTASQFYKDDIDAGALIYPGNKKYTKISHLIVNIVQILPYIFWTMLKIQWDGGSTFQEYDKCSRKVFDSSLLLFANVISKDNTFYLTIIWKHWWKIKFGVWKIEVCQSDCKLYYRNDASKVVYGICDEDRYRRQKKKNGKGILHKVLRYFPLILVYKDCIYPNIWPNITWHKIGKSKSGKLSHPTDGDEWK